MDRKYPFFKEFPPISREEWEKKIEEDLGGADYKDKLMWHTGEGIDVLPFYRKDDFDKTPSPVTIQKNAWEIRQPVTEQSITKANEIARQALENGADALEFKLNIHRTEGNIGGDLQGTAIQNQQAFNKLLTGINPEKTPLHFEADLNSPILLAMLYNLCEKKDLDTSAISGSVLFDPYAFIITNGFLPKDEKDLTDEIWQMVKFCDRRLPDIKCLGVDAGVYRNAGTAMIHEVGFALATGNEYLAALSETELNMNTVASAIHFNFAVGSNYFLEIAKFRAVRKLWQTILGEYGTDGNQPVYLHASSSKWNKSIIDPYVNMLRTTTEGMAAAIAGCDAITIHPFDDIFRKPDDFSRRIARNSQLVIKNEAYFDKVTDPSAGSYYIETITDKIAEEAWKCFQEVEGQGGMLQSIRGGYPQTVIEKNRAKRDQGIATRECVFVGTDQFQEQENRLQKKDPPPVVSLLKTDSDPEIDHARLMTSLSKALQNGCALGDLVPKLFDLKPVDIRPIRTYRGPEVFEEIQP